MTSKDIYTILSSKPHNQHYLDRYWKFIQSLQSQTKIKGVTEEHHICPKASDLFPEYKNTKVNLWNSVHLTKRQHWIAHWMLAKSYKNSQLFAFWAMCNNQSPTDNRNRNNKITSRLYNKIKRDASIASSILNSNKVSCRDNQGLLYTVTKEEYKFRDDLKSNRKGKVSVINRVTKEKIDIESKDYELLDKSIWIPPNSKIIYHTPYGSYINADHSELKGKGNIRAWCMNPDKIITYCAVNSCKRLSVEDIGKTHRELGFWHEKI
jgi:hypothetical protein